MRKIRKVVFISFVPFISFVIFLTGCSSMNSKFDCPNQPGVTCKSIDQVNDIVDRGLIGRSGSIENTKKISDPKFYPIKNIKNNLNIGDTVNNSASNNANNQTNHRVFRAGEQVVCIWIAPYQDIYGNYHNESSIHTVVRKSNWVVPQGIVELDETVLQNK